MEFTDTISCNKKKVMSTFTFRIEKGSKEKAQVIVVFNTQRNHLRFSFLHRNNDAVIRDCFVFLNQFQMKWNYFSACISSYYYVDDCVYVCM